VDSEKLATVLDKAWAKTGKTSPLKIMVQVNTSGEESKSSLFEMFSLLYFDMNEMHMTITDKSGINPSQVAGLVSSIKTNCPHLHVLGLMTIGAYDYDVSRGPNPDFLKLLACHKSVCEELGVNPQDLELSMGMSSDFEHAVSKK
jgi:hypothetical protein